MEKEQIQALLSSQKEFFKSGRTLDVECRREYLQSLKSNILLMKDEILDALKSDLGKSYTESFMCEVGLTLSEITYLLKNLTKFTKPKRVKTPLTQFKSKSYIMPAPYGNVLIISPWNYPFLLSITPLCEAIAAGNTVILKPSNYSQQTSLVISKLIAQVFPKELVSVVLGGREENTSLLENKFDYIFFTGGKTVGKLVYETAAKNLTPVTLELGGKSPCIVDKSAKINLTAKRIVFGKFLNAGQTCVAPDYILVHQSVKDKLIEAIKREIKNQFGNALENEDYGKIISNRHFNRVVGLIDNNKVIFGGNYLEDSLKIEPTIVDATEDDAVMQEEIFGPILPVMTFVAIDEVIERVNKNPSPLALYIFASDKKVANKVVSRCRFGGGCINDVVIHLASHDLPFGGFGESGMGSYHGKFGFDTFSHKKSIVDKSLLIDLKMRYAPYNEKNKKIIEKFLK